MFICQYCSKECKNSNSHKNHERVCPQNANRVYVNGMTGRKGSNQFIKAAECGLDKPQVSDTTRQKLSEASTRYGKTRFADPLSRKKHSDAMKAAVINHPQSYTASNRGRVKQIEKYGIKFQGNWELQYYEYCVENGIQIERNERGFPYEWNGVRTYYPDFYLPQEDLFIEVKGYETERDRAKWRDFPLKLKVIRKSDIKEFRAVSELNNPTVPGSIPGRPTK